MELTTLWADYIETHSTETRNRIFEANAGQIHIVARRVKKTLPYFIRLEDIVAAGSFGLIRAIERFKPQRGCKFSTYAFKAIYGAIVDFLRMNYSQVHKGRITNMDFTHFNEHHPAATEYHGDSFDELVKGLTEQQRFVLRLCFVSGYSTRQIADAMDLTMGRIRQIKLEAMERLQAMFV